MKAAESNSKASTQQKLVVPLAICVGACLIVFMTSVVNFIPPQSLNANADIPDTEDARQIVSTIERAEELNIQAAFAFDLSQFASVYTDDPSVQLTEGQVQLVKVVRGTERGAGYLTFITAYYENWRDGALVLEAAGAKAKAQGRELTSNERVAIKDARGIPAAPRTQGTPQKTKLGFDSVVVRGDRATVRYDDSAALYEMTLVRSNGHWLIAGNQTLRVHF